MTDAEELERLRAYAAHLEHERDGLHDDLKRVVAERDALSAELRHLDEVLARRPALEDCPTRVDKVLKAIATAAERDALRAQLAEAKAGAYAEGMDDGRHLANAALAMERDALCAQLARNQQELDDAIDAAMGAASRAFPKEEPSMAWVARFNFALGDFLAATKPEGGA